MKKVFLFLIALSFIPFLGNGQNGDPKFGTIKVRKYDEQQFFVEIDHVPKYVNGANALLDDIQKGIEYPTSALEQKIDGTVMVKVVIDKFGNVTSTSIHSTPNKDFNSAAMTAAKRLQKFEPHRVKEMVVPAQFVLPIRFILPL